MRHAGLLLLAGCVIGGTIAPSIFIGDAGAVDDSALKIDACALLLASEISAVVGLPADKGLRRDAGLEANGGYSSSCVWTLSPEKEAPLDPTAPLDGKSFVILNAIQWPHDSGLARTFLEAFRKAAVNGDIPSYPRPRDFGDEALWWGDGLAVRVRDVSFGVSVFIPGLAPRAPGKFEEQLAPHILGRLEVRQSGVRADTKSN